MTDSQLDHLLKSAAGTPALPPGFAKDVWQRIHSQPPQTSDGGSWQSRLHSRWTRFLEMGAELWQDRSRFALASLSALVFIGAALAWSLKAPEATDTVAQPSPQAETHEDLAWMIAEKNLSREEFARECSLHERDRAECARLCSQMAQAREDLFKIRQVHQSSSGADGQELIRRHEQHLQTCEQTALQQVKKVTSVLKPPAAQAYVKRVLPYLPPDDETLKILTSTHRQP